MLILTRRVQESVVLELNADLPKGTRLTVQVGRIQRDIVRLAFEAPDEVGIWREEILYERDTGRSRESFIHNRLREKE